MYLCIYVFVVCVFLYFFSYLFMDFVRSFFPCFAISLCRDYCSFFMQFLPFVPSFFRYVCMYFFISIRISFVLSFFSSFVRSV